MNILEKLHSMNLQLPKANPAAGNYVPFVRTGNLLYVSGTICMEGGQMVYAGKVGEQFSKEEAYNAAQLCALNTLKIVHDALGSLDRVERVVMLNGFVNAIEGFAESPQVINGASDLFVKLFGEKGQHARAAVAVSGLPKNTTVEIQCVFEIMGS